MAWLNLSKCASHESKRHISVTRLKMIVGVCSGLLLLGLSMLSIFLVFFRARKTRNEATLMSSVGISFPRITYEDLFTATDGFSSRNLIGKGGFGSVFKAILSLDEREMTVAVKVLDLQRKGAFKSFISECNALRSIKHRNLVTTLTVCSSIDFAGNDFKALVYEFMVNCSLEEWLHSAQMLDSSQDHSRHLDLTQRLNIAIDVASAIDYLHNQCSPSIVHCDLKPNNVLLDAEMTAHVGDFGLAKLLPEALDDVSLNQVSSVGFRGSLGYVAPEYAMGGVVSANGDIYSYGILLLEMFTGKRPTDEMFSSDTDIHGFVEAALPDGVLKAVDPILLRELEVMKTELRGSLNPHTIRDHERSFGECLVSVFRIGLTCSAQVPRDRMNIADIVVQLSKTRDKILTTKAQRR